MARRAWLLLLFAAALLLWLWRSPRGALPGNAAHGESSARGSGYVATDALLIDTDDAGQVQYRLHAARIAQPTPDADIELTAPRLDYGGEAGWTLSAQRGLLPPSAQQVSLLGEVLARAVAPGETALQLRTASLRVDLLERRAESSDPVLLESGRDRLWAAGLQADMKAGELRLKSPAHGEMAHLGR